MPRRKPTDPAPALFDRPGTRRDATRGCAHCGGDGWELGPDRAPLEPARRCRCTEPAHV